MAKAQEWAERFETAPDLDVELKQFIGEIGTIATSRGNTPNAIEGAVREQKAKFLAVCSRCAKVTDGLWPVLMKAHGAEYMQGVKTFLRSVASPKHPKKRSR